MTSDENRAGSRSNVLAVFTSHWLAMVGLGLILTAIVLWAFLLTVRLRHGDENPYIGVAMAVVAGVLVLGALIAPIGLHLGRRKLRGSLVEVDRRAGWRKLATFLLVVSFINVAIVSTTSAKLVHAMESREFCGSCHVMTPEQRAFDQGAHASLLCVDCHVGEGAKGLIKSKIQGTHQLISVLTDSVEMPIASAIEAGVMVPSSETCERCHWKEQPAKASLKMIRRYREDEANTPETTLLTMNVGGRRMGGIHGAHHGEGVTVRFVASDAKRQDIPLVEYENTATGEKVTYVKKGVDAASLASAPRITMQCFDCHNRPAHAFLMPGPAVDRALTLGRLPRDLPFLKKAALEILQAPYASSDAAATAIPAALAKYYEGSNAELARSRANEIANAGGVLADIYSRNVFPEYEVTWGTYPDNRGHQDFPGCFRCHDGEHVAPSGTSITKECFQCHFPSAVDDAAPEVLELLGVDKMLTDLQKKK